MHSKSDNTEIMISDEVDEVIPFDSLKKKYQKCHKLNLNPGGSCRDSLIGKKENNINKSYQ